MGGETKMKYKKFFMPMKLQMFAEPPKPEDSKQKENLDGDDKPPKENSKDEPKPESKKYSDADVDRILNERFARWQSEQEEKDRVAKLSAEEKEKERIAKLEELERAVAQRDAVDKARKALLQAKLPSDFADFVFDSQEDVAQEKMENFTKILASYRESIVKEVLKDKTPDKPKTKENKTDDWRAALRNNLKKMKENGDD